MAWNDGAELWRGMMLQNNANHKPFLHKLLYKKNGCSLVNNIRKVYVLQKHIFRNHFLKNHFVLYIKAFKATIQNLVAACLLVYLFTDSKLKLAKLQLYNN